MKKFIKGNCMKRAVSLVLIVALSLSVAESIGSTKSGVCGRKQFSYKSAGKH